MELGLGSDGGELNQKPEAHIFQARGDPSCAGEPITATPLPLPQENILQKVVMTAFADRTVVTIAVRAQYQ